MSFKNTPFGASPARDGRVAMIDIGSNSIRFVVYDQQKRSPVPIYNEKVMCALGKGLATSGVLHPPGVTLAKETLRRFLAMGRNMEITSLHVMATAAVRDATDGKEFARFIEDSYGVGVDIITGNKEAKLGAYGVCSSMYKPKGITGDLGGGSMELVWVDEGRVVDYASLPLGSLRMIDETKGDRSKLRKLIDKRVAELSWLDNHKSTNFYAIGGSFRALAKMHMDINEYPLHILHEYTVDAKNFLGFVREIAEMSNDKLSKFANVSAKRIPALPGAAMVLERIITTAKPENIIFSASGIREGYLYEKLSPYIRSLDGLIASCTEFATKGGRSPAYANELFRWMTPLIPKDKETESERRIRFCASLLSDIALHLHPEYRAEWAYERILYSSLTGLSHRERVMLALVLYHRYQFKLKVGSPTLNLISENNRKWARLVGSALSLANSVSGGVPGNLPKTKLIVKDEKFSLQLTLGMQEVAGDIVTKRVDLLQEAYRAYVKK